MDGIKIEPMYEGILDNVYNEKSEEQSSSIHETEKIYLVDNFSASSNFPLAIKTEYGDLNNGNISTICKEEPREYEDDPLTKLDSIHYVKEETSQDFEREYVINQVKVENVPHTEDFYGSGIVQPVENKESEDINGTTSCIDRKQENIAKLHKCSFCDHTSSHKRYIRTHIKSVHLKLKPYKCHLCDYSSSERRRVQDHINCIHLKQKNFKCDLCEYSSSLKWTLQNHMNSVHLKLKPHKCELCDYSSTLKESLRKHMNLVHLKLKNYKCDLCEYSASLKTALKVHVNSVHLKLKPHKCNLCDFHSSRKRHILTHINSVHLKLKPHECGFCDYTASRKYLLQRHINSIHNMNVTL